MSDQTPTSPTASTTDGEPTESADGREHDCQQHLEYVDSEWIDSCYDDLYTCGVCEKEFRMVYLKAFLLAEEDFSLVEEHTERSKTSSNSISITTQPDRTGSRNRPTRRPFSNLNHTQCSHL